MLESEHWCILKVTAIIDEWKQMSTAKDELKILLEQQPDDSSSEEIVRELALHIMVGRGLSDSDAGRTIPNEEMGRRIRSWSK
jgi:hypothetical protein